MVGGSAPFLRAEDGARVADAEAAGYGAVWCCWGAGVWVLRLVGDL